MYYLDQLKQFKRSLVSFIFVLIIIFAGMLGITWLVSGGDKSAIMLGVKSIGFLDVCIFYLFFPLVVAANVDSFIATKVYFTLRRLPNLLYVILFSIPLLIIFAAFSYILFPVALARLLYKCKCVRKMDYSYKNTGLVCALGFIGGHIFYWMSLIVIVSIFSKFM